MKTQILKAAVSSSSSSSYLLTPRPIPSLSACSFFFPSSPFSFCSSIFLCCSRSLYARRKDGALEDGESKSASSSKCCTHENNKASPKWKGLHGLLRLSVLFVRGCRLLLLPELVHSLSLLLQLREILCAHLLSTQTTFLRSQLQRGAASVYLLCMRRAEQHNGTYCFLRCSRLLLNQRRKLWKDPRQIK